MVRRCGDLEEIQRAHQHSVMALQLTLRWALRQQASQCARHDAVRHRETQHLGELRRLHAALSIPGVEDGTSDAQRSHTGLLADHLQVLQQVAELAVEPRALLEERVQEVGAKVLHGIAKRVEGDRHNLAATCECSRVAPEAELQPQRRVVGICNVVRREKLLHQLLDIRRGLLRRNRDGHEAQCVSGAASRHLVGEVPARAVARACGMQATWPRGPSRERLQAPLGNGAVGASQIPAWGAD
mmetsp:Transcript_69255/g.225608  ORF Transcript_69255/g.225608 Transcript_69255/m.225608 type:complete len:242 (+) Transcript_69255:2313-3038(+)